MLQERGANRLRTIAMVTCLYASQPLDGRSCRVGKFALSLEVQAVSGQGALWWKFKKL